MHHLQADLIPDDFWAPWTRGCSRSGEGPEASSTPGLCLRAGQGLAAERREGEELGASEQNMGR